MHIAAAALLLVILFLSAALTANVATLLSSDPAGNGLAAAFAVLMAIAIWVLLAILLLLAVLRAGSPALPMIGALIAAPLSLAGALALINLASHRQLPTVPTAIAVAALLLLLLGFAATLYFPALRTGDAGSIIGPTLWAMACVISIAPYLLMYLRSSDRPASSDSPASQQAPHIP